MSYKWSSESALRKLKSDLTLSVTIPSVTITKKITESHNPKKDAYRACSNCGQHINFHKDGKCSK